MIGNLPASAHQQCGKEITVQMAELESHKIVIGLVNKETKALDLFISENPLDVDKSYSKFLPVKFDNLSKSFITTGDNQIDIVWGASLDDAQNVKYHLALGNYVYQCAALKAWPNDKANDLYGETADTHTVSNQPSPGASTSPAEIKKKGAVSPAAAKPTTPVPGGKAKP